MKILMITEKDAANASLTKIADAFIKRGHEIKIFAPYYSENVLMMFDKNIPQFRIDELDDSTVEWCDLIFASSLAAGYLASTGVLEAHKPIFTHNYLINKQITWGGDVMFLASQSIPKSDYDSRMKYVRIAIGEPKYDGEMTNSEGEDFLFIDSGHYPFGEKGKIELANCILNICKNFPTHKMTVKPRFLPGDKVITHRNTINMLDIIKENNGGRYPDNLNVLQKHEDLSSLIRKSKTVICMYSSAFVGAYVAGKGLVVLDGIPSEDVYDARTKTFMQNRDVILPSGALIDYRSVCEHLPDGIGCSDDYYKYILEESEHVGDKICEIVEWVTDCCKKNLDVLADAECSYRGYKDTLLSNDSISWEKIIARRYTNFLIQRALIHIDFNVKSILNVDSILKTFEQDSIDDRNTFLHHLSKIAEYRSECIKNNYEVMIQDDIDAGILLNALYILHDYDNIRLFPKKDISSFFLFRGLVANYIDNDKNTAIRCFEKYFDMSRDRKNIKEITDMSNNRFTAFFAYLHLLIEENATAKAKNALEELKRFYVDSFLLDDFYDEVITRDQGHRLAHILWIESIVYNKRSVIDGTSHVAIYGGGKITKEIVMKSSIFAEKISCIIDVNNVRKNLDGFQMIGVEDLKDYPDTSTIVVTVLHEYKRIKERLVKLYPDCNVISLSDLWNI